MPAFFADVTGAVLAGGLGTRLRSVVNDRPKVLAPVRGRPFLAYILDQLARAGLAEVVLLTGYQAEQVRASFGECHGSVHLTYSPEPEPLGTGGATRYALSRFSRPAVLLMNGDSYCDVDLSAFLDSHRVQRAQISMVVSRVADTSRFGRVNLDPGGRVAGFEEKGASGAGWINAGIYLLELPVIARIPPGRPVSLERDVLRFATGQAGFRAFGSRGKFLDIGTPESFQEAEEFFRPV